MGLWMGCWLTRDIAGKLVNQYALHLSSYYGFVDPFPNFGHRSVILWDVKFRGSWAKGVWAPSVLFTTFCKSDISKQS